MGAGVITCSAGFLQLCYLESKWEVGERSIPGARVAPRHCRSIDFSDYDLVGFYCETTAGSMWAYHRKENWSQKSPTYIRQEETAGIGLHQEVFGAHVDGDMDRPVLLSVWAVPLILARDPAIAIVH